MSVDIQYEFAEQQPCSRNMDAFERSPDEDLPAFSRNDKNLSYADATIDLHHT